MKFKPFWKSFKSDQTFQFQWHLVSPYFIALDRKERWRYSQWNTTRLVSYKTVTGSGPQLCRGALHISLFWLYFVRWEFGKLFHQKLLLPMPKANYQKTSESADYFWLWSFSGWKWNESRLGQTIFDQNAPLFTAHFSSVNEFGSTVGGNKFVRPSYS